MCTIFLILFVMIPLAVLGAVVWEWRGLASYRPERVRAFRRRGGRWVVRWVEGGVPRERRFASLTAAREWLDRRENGGG